MINLVDNGILQVNRKCQISDSLPFSKSKILSNFNINIITPPSQISLKTIAPYLNRISIENPLHLEKFIAKKKFPGNMPLSLLEFKMSIPDQYNENFEKILQNKEKYYDDHIYAISRKKIKTNR